ncbi:coiled-coil domain-containing protein 186-like [Anoplophora glabripennis]|uniref:coiled-coil domain-containing protein 186-like n=1 Tax=Anoplophora glabripennis TaxID=217634 RepID=UPI000874155D|nr:coiled-coil domain-containing protein 186-like [Anoplophora glabripennis]
MYLKILCFVFYFVVTGAGQELGDENVCYNGIKPKLDELIDLYKKSPSISNLPTFPDINSLIDEVEDIISNIINLEKTLNKSQTIRDFINNKSENVENLKNALDLLKQIRKGIDEINQLKDIHNEAVTTCSGASELYEKFRKDVSDIKSTGNAIKASIKKILKRVEDVKNKSFQVKNDLDSVKIPESLFQQYLCDSNLQSKIQDIIDTLRNIADILRREFKGVIQEKLKEIENNSDKLEKDAAEMQKSLNEDIPKTVIKTTDVTNATIEDLKKQIEDLKDELRNMNLDQTSDDYLKDVKQKLKKLANEYETILKDVFSKDNMDKAAEELETARKTLQLINDRDALKAELDDVKKLVDTLKKGGVCSKEKISVEG